MVSCKRVWCPPNSRTERSRGGFGHPWKVSLLGLMLMFSFLMVGCIDRFRIGNRPNADVLESSLRLRESTPADVVAVLGQPDGKGRALLPIDSKPRTMWSYYYEEGDLKDSRRIFLFVYFDKGLYDGYMWFSSLPK